MIYIKESPSNFIDRLAVSSLSSVIDSIGLIIGEANRLASKDPAQLSRFARLLAGELRERALSDAQAHGPEWRYLQFLVTVSPLVQSSSQGRLSDAFDLVSIGLSDETNPAVGCVECGRFAQFFSSALIPKEQLVDDIVSWGRGFWYVARALCTYRDAANELVGPFLSLLRHDIECFDDTVISFGSFAEWLVENQCCHDGVIACANLLKSIFDNPHSSAEQRMDAALYLQGRLGQAAGLDRSETAALARMHHSAQGRLQVCVDDWMLGCGDTSSVIVESAQLRTELASVRGACPTQEVLFRTVHPVVVKLAEDGKYDELRQLLGAWNSRSGAFDSPVIFVPWAAGGPLLLTPTGKVVRGQEVDVR